MKHWNIREVGPGDEVFLTELMNCPALMKRLHQIPSTQKDWAEAIELWMQDMDEEGYIVSLESRDIGWFAVNGLLSPEKKSFVKIAALLPEYQNRGIGGRVVAWILEELKRRDYEWIGLFVDWDNIRAIKCYEKCGFQTVGSQQQEWPDGSSNEQFEMELQFGTGGKNETICK